MSFQHIFKNILRVRKLFQKPPLEKHPVVTNLFARFQSTLIEDNKKNSDDKVNSTTSWEDVPLECISQKDLEAMSTSAAANIADRWLNSLTPEQKNALDVLKLEYDVMLSTGHKVPELMTPTIWMRIFLERTYTGRCKVYKYCAVKERARSKSVKKLLEKRKERELWPAPSQRTEDGVLYNADFRNRFLLRIERQQMNQFYYSRIYNALLWGQKLVFDMDFEDIMRPQDITNTIDQFLDCHGRNRSHKDPFYFYLCNMKRDSTTFKRLNKSCHYLVDDYPFTVSEKNYLDIFPREKIVYLSPDAPDMLEHFNHDDIFVVGGLVDKVVTQPVTMAKAKREGIRMAKLPIDMYYKFLCGSKSLTLDQVVAILLDMKVTNDWTIALKHLPKRKAIPLSYIVEETRKRSERRAEMMEQRGSRRRQFVRYNSE